MTFLETTNYISDTASGAFKTFRELISLSYSWLTDWLTDSIFLHYFEAYAKLTSWADVFLKAICERETNYNPGGHGRVNS